MIETNFCTKTVLLVGAGGLGCPIARILAEACVGRLLVVDNDTIDLTNLHRQVLYGEADVGRSKSAVLAEKLHRFTTVIPIHERLTPSNARTLFREADLIVEGSDNFATKFLSADAAYLEARPVIHAACVRWHGTVLAVGAAGGPCYRCVFEDVPLENVPNCAEAGILGPVAGVVGALAADAALQMLGTLGDANAPVGQWRTAGVLWTFDGRSGRTRRRQVARRADCVLCTLHQVQDTHESRYVHPEPCAI